MVLLKRLWKYGRRSDGGPAGFIHVYVRWFGGAGLGVHPKWGSLDTRDGNGTRRRSACYALDLVLLFWEVNLLYARHTLAEAGSDQAGND